MKPKMMQEAIENAEKTAQQFAENSHSRLPASSLQPASKPLTAARRVKCLSP